MQSPSRYLCGCYEFLAGSNSKTEGNTNLGRIDLLKVQYKEYQSPYPFWARQKWKEGKHEETG